MQKITRVTLAAIGLLPFSLFANNSSLDSTDVIHDSRLVIEWQQGKQVGGFVDGMMPFYGDNSHIWFTDLQAYKYGSQYETVGLGLGHRGIVDNAIYGVYGFYDYQKSENSKTYGRVSLGLERLTETWDVLANFNYYVFKTKNNLVNEGAQTGGTEGNDVFYIYAFDTEKVYSGANIEVGRTLGLANLRGYVGAYTYGGKVNGLSARLQYKINQNISFTASTRHDNARGWLTTAGIQYWIGKSSSYSDDVNLADRLRDPIVRDMTIAGRTDFSHNEKQYDSRKIYFASPNATAASDGTAADPTTYADALSKAGANGFVYLTKGDGTAYSLGNTTIGGQTLWGAGSNLYSRGVVIVGGAAANQPTLSGSTINLTGAGTLGGFTLNGTGEANGITMSNSSGTATVQDVTLTGTFTNSAINVTSSSDALIKDSTINATAARGIYIANTGGTTTVDNLTLSGAYTNTPLTTSGGIYITGSAANVVVKNSTLTNSATAGSALRAANGATVSINSSTFENSTYGIRAQGGSKVTISDSTITRNSLDGLRAEDTGTTVTLTGSNSIYDNTRDGIFGTDSAVINMTGGSIFGNLDDAVEVQSNATVTITNPTLVTGTLKETTVGSQSITLTSGGTTYSVTDGSGTLTCTTTSGVVSCVP